ncbi:hypothetical protein [Anaerovibrio sp.]|uniref:hypothetical protein n=1 Tax=Anaerovibrio sp. TaxID=1872532 RepID=UPI0025FD9AC6|nr:hypothetical protein [Anaerovibrio sp.]
MTAGKKSEKTAVTMCAITGEVMTTYKEVEGTTSMSGKINFSAGLLPATQYIKKIILFH